jgi:proteic killer suppression protein
MILSFADEATEDIFDGRKSRKARQCLPQKLWKIAQRKLDQLNRVTELGDLRIPPGNALETLRGNRKRQHSIRINQQYRICFRWTADGPADVEIVDYH